MNVGGWLTDKRDPGNRVSHFRVILTAFVVVVVWRLPEFYQKDPTWTTALVAVLIFAPAIRDLFQEIPSVELLKALASWLAPTPRNHVPDVPSSRNASSGPGGVSPPRP